MSALRKILVGSFFIWCCLGSPALAEKRVALVIGNSAYQKVSRLTNPQNDAALVADTLKSVGFESVDLRRDLKIAEMRRALRDFVETSRDADVAVVYYAGHGIEVDGVNYLIPIDAVLERDTDIYDEAMPIDRVLVSVEPARKLRLVILDACRDSPFARSMKRTIASRSIGRGLAKVEPANNNTLIAFASKAGSTAADGEDGNSPFTSALVKQLTKPGLDLRKAFGYVRDDVLKATANRQEPYLYGSLGGDDVSLVPAEPASTGPEADPQTAVRRDYELALQLGTRDGWDAFLSQYPGGFYSNLAKGQVKKMAAEEARAAAAEKAQQAELERKRLAAEGAKKEDIARAAAAAKAAEEARTAAENAKQAEQAKAAAAENARIVAQEKAVIADQARRESKVASISAQQSERQDVASDITRMLKSELRRVGCNTGPIEGEWDASSQKALELFNKNAGMKLDIKSASSDALDVVRGKTGRICPLSCESGYRADGDHCTKIACRSGYVLSDENTCEKEKTDSRPTARREPDRPSVRESKPAPVSASSRADAAWGTSAYKPCMGPVAGCYGRAIRRMSPEAAQSWCSRRPTC
jgi:uncharacterized caspase-like protein